MRKVADIVSRNFGELIEEPVGSNKVYTGTEQPILEDLGEGEFILDAVKNRPLIKVGGELKQMKVDGDGFVFYDTPSGGSMGQSLISTFEQLSQAVDTNKTYYYGFYINAARINDVGLRPAISKLGNVLKKISFDIITAFDGNFTFEWNMIFGGIQILTDGIDFTTTGLRPFEYNKYDPINAVAAYSTTIITPPTVGMVYVTLEFGDINYV